eukprot:g8228.t1
MPSVPSTLASVRGTRPSVPSVPSTLDEEGTDSAAVPLLAPSEGALGAGADAAPRADERAADESLRTVFETQRKLLTLECGEYRVGQLVHRIGPAHHLASGRVIDVRPRDGRTPARGRGVITINTRPMCPRCGAKVDLDGRDTLVDFCPFCRHAYSTDDAAAEAASLERLRRGRARVRDKTGALVETRFGGKARKRLRCGRLAVLNALVFAAMVVVLYLYQAHVTPPVPTDPAAPPGVNPTPPPPPGRATALPTPLPPTPPPVCRPTDPSHVICLHGGVPNAGCTDCDGCLTGWHGKKVDAGITYGCANWDDSYPTAGIIKQLQSFHDQAAAELAAQQASMCAYGHTCPGTSFDAAYGNISSAKLNVLSLNSQDSSTTTPWGQIVPVELKTFVTVNEYADFVDKYLGDNPPRSLQGIYSFSRGNAFNNLFQKSGDTAPTVGVPEFDAFGGDDENVNFTPEGVDAWAKSVPKQSQLISVQRTLPLADLVQLATKDAEQAALVRDAVNLHIQDAKDHWAQQS